MKVTILYDRWEGTEEYPGENEGAPRPKLDREEIAEVLERLGHEVDQHVLDGSTSSLFATAKLRTDLVFNLTESYAGDDSKDFNIAAFLELVGLHYTGSGARALHLAQDKVLAKKLLRFHGLFTPYFAVSYRGRVDFAHDIQFPLIVKPATEDGSIGIDSGSVVHSVKELMERIAWIEKELDAPSLIEEYIDGREIYVGVIGNDPPEALPLVELDLSQLPEEMPKIASFEVKFAKKSEAYRRTRSRVVQELDEELTGRIQQAAVGAFEALQLRDYARIDMRITADGRPYVIEANPNPWLSSRAEFVMAARASGRTHPQTIGEIVDVAMRRRRG